MTKELVKRFLVRLCLCLGLLNVTALALVLSACSDQMTAKRYGGTATHNLPPDQKLEGITWKEDDLWVTFRPMRPDEKPETHTFQEYSSLGILQGKVIIVESVSPKPAPSPPPSK